MSREARRIALVEDDPIMGESLVERLRLEGFDVAWWQEGSSALKHRLADLGLLICDIRLPDMSGEELFHEIAGRPGTPPVLFITAYADIDQAVRLIRAGAGDFITKPFAMDDFLPRVNAVFRDRPGGENDPVLGVSAALRDIESILRQLADHSLPILLSGETGVGKEVAARFLHTASKRAEAPFMAVTALQFPPICSRASSLGTREALSRGPTAATWATLSAPKAERCSWMRSATCRSCFKQRCCGSSRTASSFGSAGRPRSALGAGSLPHRTEILRQQSGPVSSVKIFFSG